MVGQHRLGQMVVLGIVLVLFGGSLRAEIEVSLDRTTISENESFYVEFTTSDEVAQPDFSPLQKDFRIINRSQKSNIELINGRFSSKKQWTLMLMPKRAGKLFIPAIQFGQQHSELKVIKVTAVQQGQSRPDALLFLEVEATPKKAVIQEQILVVIKIFHAVNLVNASLAELNLSDKDAIVEKLVDNNAYEKHIAGKRYRVFERRLAVFPQKSGLLTIEPVLFEGQYLDTRRRLISKQLKSKAIELKVNPKPRGFSGDIWLPAKSLELKETWPAGKSAEVKAGEPMTRTIVVIADGVRSTHLPQLASRSSEDLGEEVKQYPDKPIIEDKKSTEGIMGLRQEKIAYIPTKPGLVSLPAIELPWYNTMTQKHQVARLPSRMIRVVPADGSDPAQGNSDKKKEKSDLLQGVETASGNATSGVDEYWYWVAMACLLGWLLTSIAWLRQTLKRKQRNMGEQEAQNQISQDITQLLKQLKRSCELSDGGLAKSNLLQWAQIYWQDNSIQNLGQIAARVDSSLAREIRRLNALLYSTAAGSNWPGEALWLAMQSFMRQEQKRKPQAKESPFKPLFRLVAND